jgi:D-alanine-D-alanine ligase
MLKSYLEGGSFGKQKGRKYMSKKIKVVVLFGGKSAEHEVSIQSAKNVVSSLDPSKYDVVEVKIDKNGEWATEIPDDIDVVFPVLHGPYGEDGSMQGFLKIKGLPFVGPSVLGSAVAMDKDVAKRLLRDAGLPVGKFLTLCKPDVIPNLFRDPQRNNDEMLKKVQHYRFADIEKELGLPFFIKPANLGSSVGISKVHTKSEFDQAINEAFLYDTKIIVEEFIKCREIECSVLGNDDPKASIPGEVTANHEFYDYDAKYIDENGAQLKIPADLSDDKIKEVQNLAIKTFKVLCLEGMARVDFFLTEEGKFLVNEANTLPGFTNISMYPKLWEASGISYSQLVDELIILAVERFEKEKGLRSTI